MIDSFKMQKLIRKILLAGIVVLLAQALYSQKTENSVQISIEWNTTEIYGSIDVTNGSLRQISIESGQGSIDQNRFNISGDRFSRLEIEVMDAYVNYGPGATIIHVNTKDHPFSFFLRDINKKEPVYIPHCKAVVLEKDDHRHYSDIQSELYKRQRLTKIESINRQPESSFSAVEDKVRDMNVPIWLGMSRDMRLFEISEELEDTGQEAKIIRPKYSSSGVKIPDLEHGTAAYIYALGRGKGVENNITRYLEEGGLPVYHSELKDDDVIYHTTSFVSFEIIPLNHQTNKGTNYMVSDKHSYGRTFHEEDQVILDEKMKSAYEFDDKAILYSRTQIVNNGDAARYAWIKTPRPGTGWWGAKIHTYDSKSGFSSYSEDRIFCVSLLNGDPLTNEELAILLMPGESVEYDFYMPHIPVNREEAKLIRCESFDARLHEAKSYWKSKLTSGGSIKVPEKRIDEMIRAGLLHLDLITYGEEPDGTLAANVGNYSPIGTESSPIIQFYLSMGWNDIAKRAINYFLDTQMESGFIQNYGGYMVETGAALWTMGEYFRYTKDRDWVAENKDKFIKSCNYLIDWRNRNKKPEYKGKGYGMIDGKVADPEDPFHQFMLNGYGYLGVKRISEILQDIDPAESRRLQKEAEGWKSDIKESLHSSMGRSPVVPLGDGTWSPTVPPWPEKTGLRAMYLDNETFWTHGTFTASDAMLGPLYLVFCEVLAPEDPVSKMMLKYHSELLFQGNSAFSQPYYSRHNWLQAKLGMVKPFLNTYYHTMAAHADRQTYTFWEHMYRVSPHKTHEEAWFLMETRWMLYMEEGDTLSLLKTIPRDWMGDGKEIVLEGVQSYYGSIDLNVSSHVRSGYIEAQLKCEDSRRKPAVIRLRIPHPENKRPKKVIGGDYDPETESILITPFSGESNVRVEF